MENYNINDLIKKIESDSSSVVLYGAGILGGFSAHALKARGMKVDYFCDGDVKKQGEFYHGIKVISPKELVAFSPSTHIFLCNNYFDLIVPQLEKMNFKNIYNCIELLECADFSSVDFGMPQFAIKRQIELHRSSCAAAYANDESLHLKYVDIIITERCSLKCKDCSNLMQYYTQPKNCDLEILFKSVDKLMECVDSLYEFRVIGGEPFMNSELHEVIKRLVTYKSAASVVIYTNGTIIPFGENLTCLKDKKVALEITNYGDISRNFDKIAELFKANGIQFTANDVAGSLWDDCAVIKYDKRIENQLAEMFKNCCANDIISLLHGKLYRCPISAHATNLGAIPFAGDDIIELVDNAPINILKKNIIKFYKDKNYLLACQYCKGRTQGGGKVRPAVQIKHPLPL